MKQKNSIRQKIEECEDLSDNAEIRKRIRSLGRNLKEVTLSQSQAEQVINTLVQVKKSLRAKEYHTAEQFLSEAERIKPTAEVRRRRRIFMGLLDKFRSNSKTSDINSKKKMIEKEKEEADRKIVDLERKIASLYDEYDKYQKMLEEKANQCAGLRKGSSEYARIKLQASDIYKKLRVTESNLNQYIKVLESNNRYQAMLVSGETTFDLKLFMPDINKTNVLMNWISDERHKIDDDIADMDRTFAQFESETFENKQFDPEDVLQDSVEKTDTNRVQSAEFRASERSSEDDGFGGMFDSMVDKVAAEKNADQQEKLPESSAQ